ncbi:MAG TPA: hypothetical protein VHX17_09470 [Candidatus Cybelea sp.]|nr:hypothetical protein [Candidatus Cybelea sp.]
MRELLMRMVRLENRLETSGVLPKEYDEHGLRFVLEYGLPLELEVEGALGPRRISLEFVYSISDWLKKHEKDASPSYIMLELAVAGTNKALRGDLLTVLEYFARSGQWKDMLLKMADGAMFDLGLIKKMIRAE